MHTHAYMDACAYMHMRAHARAHAHAHFTDPIAVIRQLNLKQIVTAQQTTYINQLKLYDRAPNNTI